MKKNITLVTGLFDLGRGNLQGGFNRSFDHYIECFKRLLNVDFPMVIFVPPELNSVVWEIRKPENTRIINKTVEEMKNNFPFYDRVQKIRTNPEWINQSGWIVDSTQAKLDMYNPIVMSKQFMLNDAAIFNFFETKHFMWIDAGISNTIGEPSGYLNEEFERRVTPLLNKMLYICFPYGPDVPEVHGFNKAKMNEYAGAETAWVARGGFFGGPKETIHQINDIYYGLLNDSTYNGLMGTEESIFTIITYKHKDKCNVRMIEGNCLIFEDLKKEELPPAFDEKIAVYVLTYNIPKQFELWVKSFKETFPNDFNNCTKYVINNSNDPNVDAEYKALFAQYGFKEYKFDNIGICGGRQFAADHFHDSPHSYMIFFEDDMLFHNKEGKCKSGFTTYHPELFDKAVDILNNEKLDYLKLTFSEFYGDNHDNWAWYNVPLDKKDIYFPQRADHVSPKKVKIEYTGTHRGMPFAVGEYFYCNWPLLFSKEGNKKVFIDTKFEHKYEQTWMSFVMTLMREGKVKAGCLLASPINHHREIYYDGTKRRENEFYKN
jgi:hypothetical protein